MGLICKNCGKLILGNVCYLCTLQQDITKAIFAGLLEGLAEFLQLNKKCEKCGTTWNDIASTGRLGCARDYELFSEELKVFLRKYHGTDKHMI